MTSTEPADFRVTLRRYADVMGFLYSLAQDDLATLTDEELAAFGTALDGPTSSNCWFATHDAAQYLRPIYDAEVYRRTREKEHPHG